LATADYHTQNGFNLSVVTRTFRVEAEGIVDDRVAARLTAIVQKRTDVDPPSVVGLEWSAR